ncbi:di-trans,poly-cis-decaprenylcistransferase, partial [Turicibacter sanguinis]|nr:di-trans,poly-cis-decaprenylcistransferase [Turicibacter sanguinis]
HQEGAMNVREITKLCGKLGVKALTVYAFSTENWKRPEEEVKFLMKLPLKFFDEFAPELIENDIRLKVIGNTEDLPTELQEKIRELSHQTKDNQTMTLTIALNYGSQDEIKQAVQQIAKEVKAGELKVEEITEDVIENHLMTHDLPPLDLMIRTSGEQRISNYLLWQLAYAELYFTSVAWPDFKENQLYEAIYDYQKRNRRFGGLTETK